MYASHIANVNPIRYRGYYYDVETGFYYLQSRYYDPEVGRFINADGLVSTGQGVLGFNMYAYCGNNPVNRADPTGESWAVDALNALSDMYDQWEANHRVPLKNAQLLFGNFLFGDGSYIRFGALTSISRKLKNSPIMQKKIEEEIAKFENGESYGVGSVYFDSSEKDLWLAIRWADFKMTIETETRTRGFWFFKRTQTRYNVFVTVTDRYNFNSGNESGDGVGSLLNNAGYWLQENHWGTVFDWEANYVYTTAWR